MPKLHLAESFFKGHESARRGFLDMRRYQLEKAAQERQSMLDERQLEQQQYSRQRQSILDERRLQQQQQEATLGEKGFGLREAGQQWKMGQAEREFERQSALDVMDRETFGLEKGLKQQRLVSGRAKIKREGGYEALRRLMAGDETGALDIYNSTGEHRMSDVSYDQDTGVAILTDDQGRTSSINARQFLDSVGELEKPKYGTEVPFPELVETQKIRMEAAKRRGRGDTQVTIGPEGDIIVSPGTAFASPKGAQASLFKDAIAAQTSMATHDRIKALYEPKFLTYKGMAKSKWATFLNKLDPAERSAFQGRRAHFISEVGREFLAFRKWSTGLAGSEKEMAEIKRISFSENDSPQDFEVKLRSARDIARRINARIKAALVAGVDNEREYKSFIEINPLGSVPTMQKRGDELLKQGYDKPKILEILKTEGYF